MDGHEIGDIVRLASKPGEPAPDGLGVVVGYLIHYPDKQSIAAFQDDLIMLVDDHDVDDKFRDTKVEILRDAKETFSNAIGDAIHEFGESIRNQLRGGRDLLSQGEKFLPKTES